MPTGSSFWPKACSSPMASPTRCAAIRRCARSTWAPAPRLEPRMLEVKGLNAAYGQAHILFDIELAAGSGEVVVLLGRNGAGKSTTLKSMIGLVRPLSGEIR